MNDLVEHLGAEVAKAREVARRVDELFAGVLAKAHAIVAWAERVRATGTVTFAGD